MSLRNLIHRRPDPTDVANVSYPSAVIWITFRYGLFLPHRRCFFGWSPNAPGVAILLYFSDDSHAMLEYDDCHAIHG